MVVQSSFQVLNEALNEREGTEPLDGMMRDGTRVVCHPALDEVPENLTLLPLCDESSTRSLPLSPPTLFPISCSIGPLQIHSKKQKKRKKRTNGVRASIVEKYEETIRGSIFEDKSEVVVSRIL